MTDINKVNVKNIADVIVEYLKKNGFDGLCCEEYGFDGLCCEECGCDLDDLFPCEPPYDLTCSPGYKIPCKCGEGCDFHISTKKPS